MEMNLDDVHPDLQEHVQTIHDAIRAIVDAKHINAEERRVALQETENLYDEAYDTVQEDEDTEEVEDVEDDETEELEGDDYESDIDDSEEDDE